jgi:hypothetical protein
MSPVPVILCASCGTPGSGTICAKCKGALVKVCPNCEFKNSPQKNYCDACGTEIRLVQGGSTAPSEPPKTLTSRTGFANPPVPQAPSEGMNLPQAGRSGQNFEAAEPPRVEAPPKKPAAEKPEPRRVPMNRPYLPGGIAYFAKSVLAILAMIAMGGGALLGLLLVRRAQSADVLVPKLAKHYLESLVDNDYATAYDMLTAGARSNCTLDEFRLLRDTTPWSWSNLTMAKIEPDAVIMQYDLNVQGRLPIRDTLVFVHENHRWARPYNWPVLAKAEEAFERNDPDLAIMKANEAVRLDPRDPMARGYLCESVYFRKLTDRVEPACRTALELAQRYPSKLTAKSLFHLHTILADTYKNASHDLEKAAAEYTVMLGFPDISAADQCDLLLARADVLAGLSRADAARADFTAAQNVCVKNEDLQFARKREKELAPR